MFFYYIFQSFYQDLVIIKYNQYVIPYPMKFIQIKTHKYQRFIDLRPRCGFFFFWTTIIVGNIENIYLDNPKNILKNSKLGPHILHTDVFYAAWSK